MNFSDPEGAWHDGNLNYTAQKLLLFATDDRIWTSIIVTNHESSLVDMLLLQVFLPDHEGENVSRNHTAES